MPLTYTLKLTLRNTKPPVWRRLTVPADYTLTQLHQVIQVAMGWYDYHLWEFWNGVRGVAEGGRYGPIPEGETAETWFDFEDQQDAATVRLAEVLTQVGQKLLYTYDMGDDWEHQLLVEAIEETDSTVPQCLTGRRACPPEDCGGIWGYAELLDQLARKKRLPAHYKGFDPAYFDKDEVNEELQASFAP